MIPTLDIRQIIHKALIVFMALAMLLVASYGAARAEQPQVTFSYLYDLVGFGTDGKFNNPQDVFVDESQGEIFIADTRHHRVKIFNSNGMMLFQFGSELKMRGPSVIAVDSRGIIYVLHGSMGEQVVSVYNYRGVFRKVLSYEDMPLDVTYVNPTGIAVDGADNLYVLDDQETVKRMLVFGPEGKFIKSYRIMQDLDEKQTKESFCSKPFVAKDGTLYVSNPMLGNVYVYSPTGEFIRRIGVKGGAPGKLTFPSDVAIDAYGHVLVLDAMRHNILVYNKNGTFISEFGGFGLQDGWFYMPISIAVDSKNRVYVAQVVNDRVQVLQLRMPAIDDTLVSENNPKERREVRLK